MTQTAFSVVLLIARPAAARNTEKVSGFDQSARGSPGLSLSGENGSRLGNRLMERLASGRGTDGRFSQFGFGQGSNRVCYRSDPTRTRRGQECALSRWSSCFRPRAFRSSRDEFTAGDRYGAPKVAIINETTARHYFHGGSPLGKRFSGWPTDPKDIEIVGVAKDAKYDNLKQPPQRLAYMSILQEGPGPQFVQIRVLPGAARPGEALIADCRAVIRGVNPGIRISSFEPISAAVNRTLGPERLVSSVSTGFGIAALLLTSVGLYGVLAYS